jgi:23S rRNA (uracil1939-C5)-methyltransferase
LSPEKIVYISCNPETQQRDLFYLTKNGYKVKKIQPVDMFPYTSHVECVALLSKA